MGDARERPGAFSGHEAMIVSASRLVRNDSRCFAGIGLPSEAAIHALHHHASEAFLVFESGALGSRPHSLPGTIADPELAATAQSLVSVPEIFNYWLQPGRLDLGMLGAAQVDRHGNINSTVIGDYKRPTVRLPGAGGAPEIAAACQDTVVLLHQSRRSFVEQVDFVTTAGHHPGRSRRELGLLGHGPRWVVSDLGVYECALEAEELVLVMLQPGADLDRLKEATGWDLLVSPELSEAPPPSPGELDVLRALRAARDRPIT